MQETWKNLKFAWQYAKDQKGKLIKYIISNAIAVIISIVVPILSAQIIIDLTENQFLQLILIAIVIFIIENARNFTSFFSRYYSQVIYRESSAKIRIELGKMI